MYIGNLTKPCLGVQCFYSPVARSVLSFAHNPNRSQHKVTALYLMTSREQPDVRPFNVTRANRTSRKTVELFA